MSLHSGTNVLTQSDKCPYKTYKQSDKCPYKTYKQSGKCPYKTLITHP